jgi:beta-glucosidase/6-phospho-beta-glucosidase/beta-galactosidase
MTTFPADFHWGYATASAQVEGSVSVAFIAGADVLDRDRRKELIHLGYFLRRPIAQ